MEYLVIDVGGTAIKYACMNENAEFLERGEIPTPMDSLDSYLAALGTIIHRYDHNVEGIAMCVPGIIDSVQGVCITGGNLRYVKGLPLATLLEERYGLRVSLENDSIHKGSHFSAGEISFIEKDGDISDICNSVGYQNGVLSLYRLVEQQTGIPAAELDGIRIFEMANRGDAGVLEAIDRFAKSLARVIHNIQAIYAPEVFAVGGAISQQNLFIESLIRNVDSIYNRLPFTAPRAKVVPCRFRNASNLVGALYHHLATADPSCFRLETNG